METAKEAISEIWPRGKGAWPGYGQQVWEENSGRQTFRSHGRFEDTRNVLRSITILTNRNRRESGSFFTLGARPAGFRSAVISK